MFPTTEIAQEIERIAIEECVNVETLETRHSDSLDFHDISVWELRAALKAAFELGQRTQK